MKVLILANNDAGVCKFRKELIEELIHPGVYIEGRKETTCDVYVSVPEGEFTSELKKMGCKIIKTPIDTRGVNPITDLKLIMTYRKVVRKVNPDIVFGYTIKPNIYGGMACAEKGITYVANITGLGTAVEKRGVLQVITLILYRIALRNVKTVFFQNNENEQFFTKYNLCLGKHKMLPGSGVNLNYYELIEYPDDEITEFAFISRVMKEKGIEQYLDAAKVICNKYPNTRFHIYGSVDKDYEKKIYDYETRGIIFYHGYVADMRKVYEKIHCVVHPTYYPEGLSNVLLESAASGRPIITTNRSGCREVIVDGENGFLVKEQDSVDLIAKIEKFLSLNWEERKAMGISGRVKVEREFDRKIVVEKYIKELLE